MFDVNWIYLRFIYRITSFYIIGCSGVSVVRCAFWRNDIGVVSSKPAVGACKILVCFILPLIIMIKNNKLTRFGCVLWTFCKDLIKKHVCKKWNVVIKNSIQHQQFKGKIQNRSRANLDFRGMISCNEVVNILCWRSHPPYINTIIKWLSNAMAFYPF